MSTTAGNGLITFGDGTSLSSGNLTYSKITGAPTLLSQFTNDLGNYGGFLAGSNIDTSYTYNSRWAPSFQFAQVGSNVKLTYLNCNCVCNC